MEVILSRVKLCLKLDNNDVHNKVWTEINAYICYIFFHGHSFNRPTQYWATPPTTFNSDNLSAFSALKFLIFSCSVFAWIVKLSFRVLISSIRCFISSPKIIRQWHYYHNNRALLCNLSSAKTMIDINNFDKILRYLHWQKMMIKG